ncbi:CU044_5270 family protein [Streptomyces sp. NPDC001744]|uniref:CU044_5270 family protein n=1 Tax=Streptomyces sp. NPDC001744 TaxID=3364606 RepID=UPI00369B50C1
MNPDANAPRTAHRNGTGDLPEPLLAIGDRDLPPGRHRFHKERLMNQIHDDRRAAAPRAPFLRKVILLPAATVLAGALAVGVLALTPDDAPAEDRAVAPVLTTGPALTTTIGTVDAHGAPRLLDRISLAAAGADVPRGRAGQYLYIESRAANTHVKTVNNVSRLVSVPLHTRQSWQSPDGREGWLIEPGTTGPEGITLGGTDERGKEPTPHLGAPSYDYLAGLPTDPDALLRKIYEETEGQGNGKDQQAFSTIGDLLGESWPSPELAAALYRAAAKIPGVVTVDSATDAAGRKGVAVARLDEVNGQRTEWIFDSRTFTFLGERTVQVEDSGDENDPIKPGTVIYTHAIMVRAFVDGIRVTPSAGASS